VSTTYSIVCHKCKRALWAGQGDFIYTAPASIKALQTFLVEHSFHPLEYTSLDDTERCVGYDEV